MRCATLGENVVDTKSLPKKGPHTNFQVLLFVVILCFVCAFLLAIVAFALRKPQREAKEFDRHKQMLISAKILTPLGYFVILEKDGTLTPAIFDEETKILMPMQDNKKPPKATDDQIHAIANSRIRPLLTDEMGDIYTLEDKNITLSSYLEKNKKMGFAHLKHKLFYAILHNTSKAKSTTAQDIAKDLTLAEKFVIPVSGFGLWAPIYGYIALGPDGDEVIGATWYDQAETPGLGANIASPVWQKQFFEKEVFQAPPEGKVDFQTADMGILVVKGKVRDVLGDSPKAKSAVDGISGATLTGDGVTEAYKASLTPYRQLLIKLRQEYEKREKNDE